MVNKNPLSEKEKEAIQDFISSSKRELEASKEFIENLEKMMTKRVLIEIEMNLL